MVKGRRKGGVIMTKTYTTMRAIYSCDCIDCQRSPNGPLKQEIEAETESDITRKAIDAGWFFVMAYNHNMQNVGHIHASHWRIRKNDEVKE